MNLMTRCGHSTASLRRYGFVSPLLLLNTDGRNRWDEQWMKVSDTKKHFVSAGMHHMIVCDRWVDVDPVIAHLRDTTPKLDRWSAALVIQNRRQETYSIFGFANAADAVRLRMFIDG